MKNLIKDYWTIILPIVLIIFIIWMSYGALSDREIKVWYTKSLSNLTIGDILIIVIFHAWISRSETNCNCKDK